jgi:hypothetical protein
MVNTHTSATHQTKDESRHSNDGGHTRVGDRGKNSQNERDDERVEEKDREERRRKCDVLGRTTDWTQNKYILSLL